MKIEKLETKIEIPEVVQVEYSDCFLIAKGPKGENRKRLLNPLIKVEIKDGLLTFYSLNATKREKKLVGTFVAHAKNMIKGVQESFVYKLKICSGHFPMNVSISGDEFVVSNFLGEKVPRKLKLKQGAKVSSNGNVVTVESCDKEIAGQIAADIEKLTRITKRDKRIFQDGIFIIEKAGKKLV